MYVSRIKQCPPVMIGTVSSWLAMLNVSTNLFIPETVRTENCAGNGIRRNSAVRTENCAGNGIRRNSAVTHNDLRVERIEIVQIRIVATFGNPTRDSEGDNVKIVESPLLKFEGIVKHQELVVLSRANIAFPGAAGVPGLKLVKIAWHASSESSGESPASHADAREFFDVVVGALKRGAHGVANSIRRGTMHMVTNGKNLFAASHDAREQPPARTTRRARMMGLLAVGCDF